MCSIGTFIGPRNYFKLKKTVDLILFINHDFDHWNIYSYDLNVKSVSFYCSLGRKLKEKTLKVYNEIANFVIENDYLFKLESPKF